MAYCAWDMHKEDGNERDKKGTAPAIVTYGANETPLKRILLIFMNFSLVRNIILVVI